MPATYAERREKPWGHEVVFTPGGCVRTGKLLFIRAGCRLSLQYHDMKEETMCLISGEAAIWLENPAGTVERLFMEPHRGYHVPPFLKHRLEAITDAVVVETSAQEKGNTFRLEDDHERKHESFENSR